MDNFRGHVVSEPSNIKILFLQPNITSILQPLDLGIIKSLKDRYKSYLSSFITSSIIEIGREIRASFSILYVGRCLLLDKKIY